ncbi:uncharacterized protein LOC129570654 [Sitodiplosis mosellana]|uniref:uncharacterized protein LOC129570654 n=1 Tax=Sitodiplosis mosellana TaxID=263140 RepID=UPI00244388C4|nr:uncharacterized protein LOC129570654 [Sitodiplosis mosellana]
MKVAVLLAFACFSVCYVIALNEVVWGTETQSVLGNKKVEVKSGIFDNKIHTYVFTFPQDPTEQRFPILGIKHVDYKSHPVTVHFLKGGIGDTSVTILVESQRGHGIKSEFVFFT